MSNDPLRNFIRTMDDARFSLVPRTNAQKLEIIRNLASAAPAGAGKDPILTLIAEHAKLLDDNEYAYFELAYTRQTGWMAWLTDRPAQGEPGTAAYAKSRKVIARGQGDTAQDACADAVALIAARTATPADTQEAS